MVLGVEVTAITRADYLFFVLWLGGVAGGQCWPSPFFAVNSLDLLQA